MDMLQSADFWLGLLMIIWINIILSGDNAVVIALASRSLPPNQQKQAIFWGSAAAIILPILIVQDVVGVWAFRKSWDGHVLGWMLPGAALEQKRLFALWRAMGANRATDQITATPEREVSW